MSTVKTRFELALHVCWTLLIVNTVIVAYMVMGLVPYTAYNLVVILGISTASLYFLILSSLTATQKKKPKKSEFD